MNMKKRIRMVAAACALAITGHLVAATTEEIFLHVNPPADDWWHVATSNPMDVVWEKPAGAANATLSKTVLGNTVVRTGITDESVSLGVGQVQSPKDECVADLVLTFDDLAGTVQRSSLAFLADVSEVRNPDGARWNRLNGSALLPLTSSSTALTVAGTTVPPDTLDGTGGWWYFAGRNDGSPVAMTLYADGDMYSTSVFCSGSCGMVVVFR